MPSLNNAAALKLYQVKEQLQLGNIVINGNANTGAVAANGVHVNAYFGDANGDRIVDGLDKLVADNVAQGRAAGFAAYVQLDPVIVGDVAGDFSVDAGDVSTIDAFIVQLKPAQIPQPPTQLLVGNVNFLDRNLISSPNSVDPTLSLSIPDDVATKVPGASCLGPPRSPASGGQSWSDAGISLSHLRPDGADYCRGGHHPWHDPRWR